MHVELLARLHAARNSPTLRREVGGVSSAFQAILPFLKLYAQYCSQYCAALEALERLRTDRPAFAAAIQRAEAEIANHRQGEGDLRLSSCMIRPVKRLCLYPLLLCALLKELDKVDATVDAKAAEEPAGGVGGGNGAWSSSSSSSICTSSVSRASSASSLAAQRRSAREALSETAEAVQQMASQVNTMVNEADNRVRMLELHERLRGRYAGLLSPSRQFVREIHAAVTKHEPSHHRGSASGYASAEAAEPNGLILAVNHYAKGVGKPKKHTLYLLSDRLLLTRPDRATRSSLGYLKVKADLPLASLRIEWARPDACLAPAALPSSPPLAHEPRRR